MNQTLLLRSLVEQNEILFSNQALGELIDKLSRNLFEQCLYQLILLLRLHI